MNHALRNRDNNVGKHYQRLIRLFIHEIFFAIVKEKIIRNLINYPFT